MSRKSKTILIAVMCICGCAMHFVLDIITNETAQNILGVIFPVNETSWEHMKMIWYPFLAGGIVSAVRYGKIEYVSGFVVTGFIAMLIQLGIFSFYQSFSGSSILILDIVFYTLDMIFCALQGLMLAERKWAEKTAALWIVMAVFITAGIIYLTYCPGEGYVFMDNAKLAG